VRTSNPVQPIIPVVNKEEIPAHWNLVPIGDICASVAKVQPKDNPTVGFKYIDISGIDNKRFMVAETKAYYGNNAPSRARQLVREGDIIFSTVRTYLKNMARITRELDGEVASTGLCVLRPKAPEYSGYLYYYLQYEPFLNELAKFQRGTSYPAVRDGDVFAQLIPVPSKQEAACIVAEIEKQFSRLDEAVAGLKRIKANLKRYKAAVLKAAVEGRLTAQWRQEHFDVEPASDLLKRILAERKKKWEEKNPGKKYREPVAPDTSNLPELPKGWVWATTDQLFSFVTSGSRGWASYYSDSGPLFLRMGNLDHDTIKLDLSDIQRVQPPAGTEGMRTRVKSGDILISITADVGMVGLIPDGFEEAYINQHIALVRPETLNAIYLAWFLACKNGQDQLNGLQRGATKVGLGLDDIKAVNVPLPPRKEQTAIIQEIDCIFSVADEIEAIIESDLKRAERLRQAVLRFAFSGELSSVNKSTIDSAILLEGAKP